PIPGPDVLLSAQGCKQARLLLPSVYYPLLVADIHLHMGGSAPLVVHVAARLGAVAGNRIFHHAYSTLVGWNAERPAQPSGCVGPRPRRPGTEIHGGNGHRIRYGHAGSAAVVTSQRERSSALYRLDHCTRSRWRLGVERLPYLWHAVLACSPP